MEDLINLKNIEKRYPTPLYTSTYRASVQPCLVDADEAHRRNKEMWGIGFKGMVKRIGNFFYE